MKVLNFIGILAIMGLVAACSNQPEGQQEETAQVIGQPFGDTITADGAISYEAMLAQMAGKDSIAVKVMGEVESVCQKKGCWMNIVSADPGKGTDVCAV